MTNRHELSNLCFEDERRSRLNGVLLGAPGKEFVTVRAGDLRQAVGLAMAVEDAIELIGENEVLKRTIIQRTAEAEAVPALRERIAVLEVLAADAQKGARLQGMLDIANAQLARLQARHAAALSLLSGKG